MLTHIRQFLQKIFDNSSSYQSELEQFIISKHPASTAEIEHWAREFDRKQRGLYGR